MRRVAFRALVAVAVVAGSAQASAPCAKDGLIVFPAPGAVVPTNVRFILEGVGAEQARVSSLVGTDGAVLRAGNETVAMKVQRGWISPMNRVAVVLVPVHQLDPQREYTMSLRTLTEARLINNVAHDGQLRWTTGKDADRIPPRVLTKPAISEGNYVKTEAGLTRWLKLRASIEEKGPVVFLVSMKRARGASATQTYPAPLDGEYAMLGHDTCSGNFGFDDGRMYKLEIEVLDTAGNKWPKKTRIEASAPKPLH
jgi:hypothetical protein